jgi:hypothetical protein
MSMFRQGDVLIIRVASLPVGLTARQSKVIVAGEVTGHVHALEEGRLLENRWGEIFLEVSQRTRVVHEEHRAIVLEPGVYRVIRQREYAPEGIMDVED